MEELIRLLRRLSRQGVSTGSIIRRLRREPGMEPELNPDERALLRDILESDRITLTAPEWRMLERLTRNAERNCEFLPVALASQWLRQEPVMRIHRGGMDCFGTRQ